MSTSILDWRIWMPTIVAAMCFATRALPDNPSPDEPVCRSIELPRLYGAPASARRRRYRVVSEDSSLRFSVNGSHGSELFRCVSFSGEMEQGPLPTDGQLTLRFELGSLRRSQSGKPRMHLPEVLGVLGGMEVTYRANLVSVATSDLPGVSETVWLGRLYFGSRILSQPMRLWRCALPGQPIRLQGHGPCPADLLGLPNRTSFGWFAPPYSIDLGLDLSWKRERD